MIIINANTLIYSYLWYPWEQNKWKFLLRFIEFLIKPIIIIIIISKFLVKSSIWKFFFLFWSNQLRLNNELNGVCTEIVNKIWWRNSRHFNLNLILFLENNNEDCNSFFDISFFNLLTCLCVRGSPDVHHHHHHHIILCTLLSLIIFAFVVINLEHYMNKYKLPRYILCYCFK